VTLDEHGISSRDPSFKRPSNLCSTCAQYDWEYHIHRYGDNRFVEDRKAWNDDAEQRLRIPRTDNKGGRYFMAATDTRFFLRTFLDAKTNSTRCDLCRVIVLRAQRNEQLNALITDSSEKLLCCTINHTQLEPYPYRCRQHEFDAQRQSMATLHDIWRL
jgi:hypothetical protein